MIDRNGNVLFVLVVSSAMNDSCLTGEENSLQEVMYEGRVDNRNPFWSEEALFFSV